jgi:tRNA(fMet)-specific endonuclease VapC
VVISAITYAELEFGVSVCANPERERRNLDALVEMIEVQAFDHQAARSYGPVRRATRERKSDHLDKLIAAHSIASGTVLVTNNECDFAHYPGLVVENWLKLKME